MIPDNLKLTSKGFNYKIVYQIVFWIIAFVFLISMSYGKSNISYAIITEAVNILFYLFIVYFNLYYLIPNYLHKEKYLIYIGTILLLSIVITPIKLVILYLLYSGMPDIQASIVLNRNLYFIVSFIVIACSTIWQIIIDWLNSERDRKELQTKNMQSELKFLKSQINPHFLFNTLNNLYALTLKKSDQAPDIVLKLSEIMRYMLYECNEKRVYLRNELNYIQNYLDLEKLRQGQKIAINFTIKGNPDQLMVAPLIFTPFLENSFKHGLSNALNQGFVNIFMEIKDENILFLIENSKSEKMPKKHHSISGGIGLVNVKQRLELIYPNQYELIIDDSPLVYSVTLKIIADKN